MVSVEAVKNIAIFMMTKKMSVMFVESAKLIVLVFIVILVVVTVSIAIVECSKKTRKELKRGTC